MNTKKYSFLFLLFSFLVLKSQEIKDFETLYQLTLIHHPNIKISEIEKNKIETQLKEIGALNPISIQYEGGQLNGNPFDTKISATQDFSYLQLKKEKKQWINAQIEAISAKNNYLVTVIKKDLEEKYQLYLLQKTLFIEWQKLEQEFQKTVSKLKLQYEVGEIDKVQFTLSRNELLSISTKKELQELEYLQTESEILKYSLLPKSYFLSENSLTQLNSENNSLNANKSFENWTEKEKLALDSEFNLMKKNATKIGINAGLFTQSFDYQFFYSGILVGISIPIDKRVLRTKQEQISLEKAKIEVQKQSINHEKELKLTQAENKMNSLLKLIKNYKTQFLEDNEAQLKRIRLQLVLGEIDFVRFNQLQRSIQELIVEYWQLIYQYNLSNIEFNYYNNF